MCDYDYALIVARIDIFVNSISIFYWLFILEYHLYKVYYLKLNNYKHFTFLRFCAIICVIIVLGIIYG